MSDHREANCANEPGNSTGIEYTAGGRRIAEEDEFRRIWLDSKVDVYVRVARRRRQMMRIVREPA